MQKSIAMVLLNYADFEEKICDKTKLVSLTHVSNVSGVANDVKKLARVAHEHGAQCWWTERNLFLICLLTFRI